MQPRARVCKEQRGGKYQESLHKMRCKRIHSLSLREWAATLAAVCDCDGGREDHGCVRLGHHLHDVSSDVLIIVMQIVPGVRRCAADEAEVVEPVLRAGAEVGIIGKAWRPVVECPGFAGDPGPVRA